MVWVWLQKLQSWILNSCRLNVTKIILPSRCYDAFRAVGLEYGPGHQGIEKMYVGLDQVFAKLSMPPSVLDTHGQFILHPSLLDSALQASIGLIIGADDSKSPFKPYLPFALDELEIFGCCTTDMWVLVRYSDGSKAGDKVKNSISICVMNKGMFVFG